MDIEDLVEVRQLAHLAALHARLVLDARAAEAAARRLRDTDMERCEIAEDEALEARMQANALAELLGHLGVLVPEPNQLSLFSDGAS